MIIKLHMNGIVIIQRLLERLHVVDVILFLQKNQIQQRMLKIVAVMRKD